MKKGPKKAETGGVSELLKELWNAAVALRGNIEPADYKRYVLPLVFLRFLSLRYEQRRSEIDTAMDASCRHSIAQRLSEWFGLFIG
jgi:type I restriction enzyme M protein